MKKKIIWRLGERPTTEGLRRLVDSEILTKDEAREILFSSQDDRDKESLKSEIKFLRELVEKLSNRTKVVEVIREIESPWRKTIWYAPYGEYCNDISVVDTAAGTMYLGKEYSSFSDIKTF